MPSIFDKDPAAVLDYVFDWQSLTNRQRGSDWLEAGETIVSHSVMAAEGLTVDSHALSDDNTSVTAWLSGGTVGTRYTVTCQITTSAGRIDERSIYIRVIDR